jgi:hypothetical protein
MDYKGRMKFGNKTRNQRYRQILNAETSSDPSWSNVVLLLDWSDGADGVAFTAETAPDLSSYGHTLTYPLLATNEALGSTTYKKFGTTSMVPESVDTMIEVTSDLSAFNFGTGDWTVEWWQAAPLVNNQGFAALEVLDGAANQLTVGLVANGSYGNWRYIYPGVTATLHALTIGEHNNGVMEHHAICRDGATVYYYTNGTVTHSSSAGTGQTGVTSVRFVDAPSMNADITTYVDSLRVSDVGRYPGGTTFDVPTAKFPTATT